MVKSIGTLATESSVGYGYEPWSFIFAKADLPEGAGYLLARTLHRSEAQLAAKLEQARETTLANTLAASARRELIHPGVLKYLREAGLEGARR